MQDDEQDATITRAAPAGRDRWRAGARALLYVVLAFVCASLLSGAVRLATGRTLINLAEGGAGSHLLRAVVLLAGFVLLPTALQLQATGGGWRDAGWRSRAAFRQAATGAVVGATAFAVIAAMLWVSGAVRFVGADLPVSEAATTLATWLAIWTILAVGEEGFSRGYAFVQLSRAISFPVASILSALVFAHGHLGNAGETAAGLAGTAGFALFLAWTLHRTGALWFAAGFHATWNWTQATAFGFPNSGGLGHGRVVEAQAVGSPLLTGGSAGPEGSVLILPLLLLLVIVVHHWTRSAPGPTTVD